MSGRHSHRHGVLHHGLSMSTLSLDGLPPRLYQSNAEDDAGSSSGGGGYNVFSGDIPYMPPRDIYQHQPSPYAPQFGYQPDYAEPARPSRGYPSATEFIPPYQQVILPAATDHEQDIYEQGRRSQFEHNDPSWRQQNIPTPYTSQPSHSQRQSTFRAHSQQSFRASSSPRNPPYALLPHSPPYNYHQSEPTLTTINPGALSGSGPYPTNTDADIYLREQLSLPPGVPVDLYALDDPQPNERPGHPLPVLTKLAINGSERRQLTLQGVFDAIEERFPWYRAHQDDKPWKNSIRHNLSLNKVFIKSSRPITEPGKGHYWRLDISQGEGYKRDRKRRSKARAEDAATADELYSDQSSPEAGAHSGAEDSGTARNQASSSSAPYDSHGYASRAGSESSSSNSNPSSGYSNYPQQMTQYSNAPSTSSTMQSSSTTRSGRSNTWPETERQTRSSRRLREQQGRRG